MEDLVESLTTGKDRLYVRANKPYAGNVANLGNMTGGRGALRPSEEFTYLHQVNPISNKRLLKMKSRSWGTPDGSAFHPLTDTQNMHGIRSERVSADGVPTEFNIPEMDALRKGLPPLFSGGAGAAAALSPGEAQAAQKNEARDSFSWRNVMDEMTRGLGLGTRNVLEGLGEVADTFLNQPINAVGRLFGYDPGLVNPGKGIADAMGLPVPATDLEKNMALWESGAASAVPLVMGGGAMAKMAASPVVRGVGRALSSTPKTDIVAGGLLSRFLGGD